MAATYRSLLNMIIVIKRSLFVILVWPVWPDTRTAFWHRRAAAVPYPPFTSVPKELEAEPSSTRLCPFSPGADGALRMVFH